ncbi:MAG TPA: hypothetical protein VER57_00065, partial [Cyanobium sp.]|nr:hypothetical protein [Cyanobium sp.]
EVSRQWLAQQGEMPVDIYNFMRGLDYTAFAVELKNGIALAPLNQADFCNLATQEEILFCPPDL